MVPLAASPRLRIFLADLWPVGGLRAEIGWLGPPSFEGSDLVRRSLCLTMAEWTPCRQTCSRFSSTPLKGLLRVCSRIISYERRSQDTVTSPPEWYRNTNNLFLEKILIGQRKYRCEHTWFLTDFLLVTGLR